MKLSFAYISLLFLVLLSGCGNNLPANNFYTFSQAELLVSDSLTPPAHNLTWEQVSLPKYLRKEFTQAKVPQAWLRIKLSLAQQPEQLWSIFPTRHQQVVAIFLNNHYLGASGSFSQPITRGWNTPFMVNAPAALWKQGENIIYFRVMGYPGYGKLNPVLVGPTESIQPLFENKTFWQVDLTRLLTLLTAMVALYNLSFWLRRNKESLYGYFGLAAAFWALYGVNLWLSHVAIPPSVWVTMMHLSIDWFVIFISFFAFRLCHTHKPLFEKILLAWGVINTIVLSLTPLAIIKTVADGSHIISGIIGIYIVGFTLSQAIKTQDPLIKTFAVGIFITVALGLHDLLFNLQVIHIPALKALWLNSTYLLQLAAPILFAIMSWHLTAKFFNAMDEAETLNVELEDRIDQAKNVIETLYQEKTITEAKQATENERNRIYQDLHDDVGAKLLNIVHQSEDAKQSDYARSVLKDLRDVVSNTGGDDVSLADVLADAREETQERLQTLNITCNWIQPLDLTDAILNYNQNLSLRRIIRESVSNIIHHAKARNVVIQLKEKSPSLLLTIDDDGIGLKDNVIKGRGLSNITLRAKKLGGTVTWQASKQLNGTCMSLTLFYNAFKKLG